MKWAWSKYVALGCLALFLAINAILVCKFLVISEPKKNTFVRHVRDFGRLSNFTGTLREDFAIRNETDESLVFVGKQSSCSCTEVVVSFDRLVPAAEGSVSLAMSIAPGDKENSASIVVKLEGEKTHIRYNHLFYIHVIIERPYTISLEPEALCLGTTFSDEKKRIFKRSATLREFFNATAPVGGVPNVTCDRKEVHIVAVRTVAEAGVDSFGRKIRESIIEFEVEAPPGRPVFREFGMLHTQDGSTPSYTSQLPITWYGRVVEKEES